MREEELFAAYGSPRPFLVPDERYAGLQGDAPRPIAEDRDRDDFYRHVAIQEGPDGCHLWVGPRTLRGFGLWTDPETNVRDKTHRVAWRFVHGPIPEGEPIRHVPPCTSRACVRVDHLAIGYRRRSGSGRLTSGQVREREFRARLRDAVARSIRPDLSTDRPQPHQHETEPERALIHATKGMVMMTVDSVETNEEKHDSSTSVENVACV